MEEDLTYYQRHKARLQQAGREYHYKNREKRIQYSRNYYQTHKTELNLRRKTYNRKKLPKTRERANLEKPNPDPVVDVRRQTFQTISVPPPPPPQTIVLPPPNFTVTFE